MGLRHLTEIKKRKESPAQGETTVTTRGFVLPAGRLDWLGTVIRRALPQASQRPAHDDGSQAENAVLYERITELEDVLADYALQFGLTDRARAAFRAGRVSETVAKAARLSGNIAENR